MRKVLIYFLIFVTSADKTVNLSGLDFDIYSDQYSGYLNVSKTHRMFYWFFESQNTPSVDPLVFWFNGGPMCSSLIGLLNGNGPFLLKNRQGEFEKNEYTWSRMANIVYLESPVGVGFSYSIDGNITTDDDMSADENYVAIKEFLTKFPHFRNHEIFLTGESYAGVYIPMLASRIIDGENDYPINLKGIAIGNGYFSETTFQRTSWLYGYSHGLMDQSSYQAGINKCCNGKLETCEIDTNNTDCLLHGATNFRVHLEIDVTDINKKCYPSTHIDHNGTHPSCGVDFHMKEMYYLNSPDVKEALHIPSSFFVWVVCVLPSPYTENRKEMKEYIQKAIKNNIRVLLYYGDQDTICDFLTGQRFVANLDLEKLASKTPWFFKNVMAGYKTMYKGLTFTTIRGAGHSTVSTHSKETLHVIQSFLNDKSF